MNRKMNIQMPASIAPKPEKIKDWLSTVRDIKKIIASKQPKYSQRDYITITYDYKDYKMRTDCTGFIDVCCRAYGLYDGEPLWTGMMISENSPLKDVGFEYHKWDSWDNVRPGDILVNAYHAEIFNRMEDYIPYVYHCGSTFAMSNPGEVGSTYKPYRCYWRPPVKISKTRTITNKEFEALMKLCMPQTIERKIMDNISSLLNNRSMWFDRYDKFYKSDGTILDANNNVIGSISLNELHKKIENGELI